MERGLLVLFALAGIGAHAIGRGGGACAGVDVSVGEAFGALDGERGSLFRGWRADFDIMGGAIVEVCEVGTATGGPLSLACLAA